MGAPTPQPPRAAPERAGDAAPRSLSRTAFWFCLGASVAVFLALHPVWRRSPIGDVDRGIGWSYVVLPPLVLVCLLLERKLGAAAWFLETLKLTFAKFALTYALATAGWAWLGPPPEVPGPPRAGVAAARNDPYAPREAPAPSTIDPRHTGRVAGRVLGPDGLPLAGALVYVRDGLAAWRFAVPAEPLELGHRGRSWEPAVAVLRAFQPLVLRSLDEDLHTMQATDAHGRSVLNYPSTPGSVRRAMFHHELGRVRLGCRVHGPAEERAELLVLAHPFHLRTEADGAYAFTGVPAGSLGLAAWDPRRPAGPEARARVVLPDGGELEGVELRLAGE